MAGRISAGVRRWLPLVALMAPIALLGGCHVLEGSVIRPAWVDHPITRQGMTAFVGHGSDANSFNARLAALSDILPQLSETLGEDVRSTGWRSFSTTDKLPEYDLGIVREFQLGSDVWVMAEASTNAIERRRTSLQKEKIQQDAVIGKMMEEVEEAYRNNRDVNAISTLLDAMYACATQPSSYDVQSLGKLAVDYMNAIRLSLSGRNPRGPKVTVKVRRRQILFDPKVLDAPIQATFDATDVWGNARTDSLIFGSGQTGSFQFVPYSVAISDSGTIVFSLDISDKLERLKPVVSDALYAELQAAYRFSQVAFPFQRVSKYSKAPMLVGAADAGPFDAKRVEQSLSQWLQKKGISPTVVPLEGEVDETEVARIHARNPGYPYLLSMTVSKAEEREDGDIPLWVVSGGIQLWNLETQTVVDQSGKMTLVEESLEEAFRQLMQVVTNRFSEYL